MPSSLIFAGLVVLWLLILVPAVARHQQEVARPSMAALSGRVLERPQRRHRTEEVDDVHDTDDDSAHIDGAVASRVPVTVGARAEQADTRARPVPHLGSDDDYDGYGDSGYGDAGYDEYDDGRWERPAPRYRPGRGGFDPEAAALTARARYTFRQRVVLGMLVSAVVTAVVAVFALPGVWWLHAVVDVALVGYLVYLRRQVRMEEAIRDRRAARMAGTHRSQAADDPGLDEWARRGRESARRRPEPDDDLVDEDLDDDPVDELVEEHPERVLGTGEPPARPGAAPEVDEQPALPRLVPAPPPPLPAGTSVVDGDLDDPALHDLDGPSRPDYRRAAGE